MSETSQLVAQSGSTTGSRADHTAKPISAAGDSSQETSIRTAPTPTVDPPKPVDGNTVSEPSATTSQSQQRKDAHQLLTEIKALKAALPTQNEVAMVNAQDPTEGARLQAFCRGMIRRMQQLEKERRALMGDGAAEQRRQTVIQKARLRRDEQHMQHVQEFMLKEATRMVKKDEASEAQSTEVNTSRAAKEVQNQTAEQKRAAIEAERAQRLEEGVQRWAIHAEKVKLEKEQERERAKAIRAQRIEELSNVERVGFLLPNGQAPAGNLGAYRAAVARASRSSSQLQLNRSDSDSEGAGIDGSNMERKLSSSAPLPPPALTAMSRVEFELFERRAKEEMDLELSRKMADHLRRSELVRHHRKQVAKKMIERTALMPAFKEKQRHEQEEHYLSHVQKVSEEKEQLGLFQLGKQRILLERVEKNRARQEEAQKRVDAARAIEEQRHQQLLEKVFKEDIKSQREKDEELLRQRKASKAKAVEVITPTKQPDSAPTISTVNPRISKLSQKLMERTERIAQLYAVVPVQAEPVRQPKASPLRKEPTTDRSPSPAKAQVTKNPVASPRGRRDASPVSKPTGVANKYDARTLYPPTKFKAIQLLCEIAAASAPPTPRAAILRPYNALMLVADVAGVRPLTTDEFYALRLVWDVATAPQPRGKAQNVAIIRGPQPKATADPLRGLRLVMNVISDGPVVKQAQVQAPAIDKPMPVAASEPEAPPQFSGFMAESPDHRQHPYVEAMNAV